PTDVSLSAFLKTVGDAELRRDARAVAAMMGAATGARAVMWGTSIVGYGRHAITGSAGRAAEWPIIAFAPRGTGLVLYLNCGGPRDPLLRQLGKHKMGKCCLYIRRLTDVHLPILRRLIAASVRSTARS
ncbi:MAG: DUF1801 domain-containing protein, partial [Gemmatimonadota bacterium]